MGAGASSSRNCFSAAKPGRHMIRSHRPSRSLDDILNLHTPAETETEGVVVLSESDFCNSKLKGLLEEQPDIKHVRFGVEVKSDGRREWIPTDDDLAQLAQLRSLTALDLTGCREVTRNGLTRFSQHPSKMKTLILDDCPRITNNFFDHIIHFYRLEQLHLRGCFRISDNGIEALKVLKYLRHLDLSVRATEQATCLRRQCESPTITDASMKTLALLTQLETLQLEGCEKVSDTGLLTLATLRRLTCLNLAQTGLTDAGLALLRHFPELLSLNVSGCRISESELIHQLKKAHKLRRLNVSGMMDISETLVHALVRSHPLTHLNLSNCPGVTDAAVQHLAKLHSLTHLTLNDCSGMTGPALGSLSRLSELQALHIRALEGLDCKDIVALKKLRQLEIHARSAEDEQLSALSVLKHLTDLTLHINDSCPVLEPIFCIKVLGVRVQIVRHCISKH